MMSRLDHALRREEGRTMSPEHVPATLETAEMPLAAQPEPSLNPPRKALPSFYVTIFPDPLDQGSAGKIVTYKEMHHFRCGKYFENQLVVLNALDVPSLKRWTRTFISRWQTTLLSPAHRSCSLLRIPLKLPLL